MGRVLVGDGDVCQPDRRCCARGGKRRHDNPQADYDLYLAAVPSQQDTLLFVGTQDIYRCSLANSCAWRNTTNAAGCQSAKVAWSQHAIEATLGAQGLIYFGNDGGLWRTTDAVNQQQPACSADDATHYQNLNGGLGSLAEVEDLAKTVTIR